MDENFRYIMDALNAKHERTERRLFIVVLSLLFALIVIVSMFVWYMSLPIEEVSLDGNSGNTNYVGNDMRGDFNYGTDYREETQDEEKGQGQ